MKILIATPAYGELVHRGFTESVSDLVLSFVRADPSIVFEHRLIDLPVLSTARNVLASRVINDESYSHLLFVDADMGFSPRLIARMLAFRRPFVASIYPFKKWAFEAVAERMRASPELDTLQALMVAASYVCGETVIRPIDAEGLPTAVCVDGFVRVGMAGTGVMLIERGALVEMREKLPNLWIADPGAPIRALGLERGGYFRGFDTAVDGDGVHVGEDIAFCRRWTGLGGEIWAAVDEAIAHAGAGDYFGHAATALALSGVSVRQTRLRADGRTDKWWARSLRRAARG